MQPSYDAIIIGAGHNGLVAATYLAKAGLRTLVLERRPIVGGACVTEELFPGCRVSTGATWFGNLRPEIIAELDLYDHGLDVYPMDPQVFAPFPDNSQLFLWLSAPKTAFSVAKLSPRDAASLLGFDIWVDKALSAIRPLLDNPPLSIEEIRTQFQRTGNSSLFEDVFERSIADILDKHFSHSGVKGVFATPALAIGEASPYAPGTVFTFLYMSCAEVMGHKKTWGYAKGGMGTVTAALARSATSHGVEIRTTATVAHIPVKEGRAQGVALEDGSESYGKAVLSSVDPRRTFLDLVSASDLDPKFRVAVQSIRMNGSGSMLHFLLDGLPHFRAFGDSKPGPQHKGMIVIAPSVEYLHKAWEDGQRGMVSKEPVLTMCIQTVTDKTLAPPGKHVLSVFVQYTPYDLKLTTWDAERPALIETVIAKIEEYAPNIRGIVEDVRAFTPKDLETMFSLTRGQAEHGDMILEQLFAKRPVSGWAHYRMPIRGLYLCGSGTHPGGTVTGVAGRNAAKILLQDLNA